MTYNFARTSEMYNKNALRIALFTLSLTFLLIQVGTEAQTVPEHRGGPYRGRLFEGLALSDAQSSKIDNLMALNQERLRPLREQLQWQRRLLREAIESQPFDEALVRFQAQEIAKVQTELLVARAYLVNQLLGILTEEQKTQLSELRQQRRKRVKEWRSGAERNASRNKDKPRTVPR